MAEWEVEIDENASYLVFPCSDPTHSSAPSAIETLSEAVTHARSVTIELKVVKGHQINMLYIVKGLSILSLSPSSLPLPPDLWVQIQLVTRWC